MEKSFLSRATKLLRYSHGVVSKGAVSSCKCSGSQMEEEAGAPTLAHKDR